MASSRKPTRKKGVLFFRGRFDFFYRGLSMKECYRYTLLYLLTCISILDHYLPGPVHAPMSPVA